jgi:hypothetical protein
MAKPAIADEVAVLRFFEEEPIEAARVLFNIVSEKMRQRLRGETDGANGPRPTSGSGKKRQPAARTQVTEVPTPAA